MQLKNVFRFVSFRITLAFTLICVFSFGRVLVDVITTHNGDVTMSFNLLEFGDTENSTELSGCQFQFQQNDLRGKKAAEIISGGTRMCPHNRRPVPPVDTATRTDSYWQTQQIHDDILVLYSAYYDDRPAVGVTPWIRVLGVAKLANSTHYCHIWFPGCDAPFVTPLVANTSGRDWGYTINKIRYVQYLFSCRLPGTEPVPSHVSIVPDQCSSPSISVPVQKPIRAEPDVEFGACVAIAFGSIPVEMFVEWIEFSRQLGITEFNVYDAGMINMTQVFQLYTSRRWLNVHHMPPPVPEFSKPTKVNGTTSLPNIVMWPPSYSSVKLASPASLNDCLLRNMYRYRYTVVIDFDEFIVPRLHDNYHDMLQHIDRKYRLRDAPYTYTFANTYYFLEFKPDTKQPTHLRTMRYRTRVPPSGHGLAPKSFVDPRACLSLFNHYCLRPLRAPSTTLTHIHVNPDIARSHHYRHCGFSNKTCTEYFQKKLKDDVTLRFKSRLQPAVEAALANIRSKT